jgi:mycothiol system anti-sigma-R factor
VSASDEEGSVCAQLRAHLCEIIDAEWGMTAGAADADPLMDPCVLEFLEAHAASCPTCQAALGEERRVRDLLRRCCSGEPAPRDLRVRIVSRTIRMSSSR